MHEASTGTGVHWLNATSLSLGARDRGPRIGCSRLVQRDECFDGWLSLVIDNPLSILTMYSVPNIEASKRRALPVMAVVRGVGKSLHSRKVHEKPPVCEPIWNSPTETKLTQAK